MFFRIVAVCIVLAAGFLLFQIWTARSQYDALYEPAAAFTVRNTGNQTSLTIVEFLNYGCGACKTTHRILLDYAEKNPDVKLVVRPVPFMPENAETAAERALAAGLQGKFWEMDNALSDYNGVLDDKFYRESAALYDIDFNKMVLDSNGKDVFKLAKDNASAAISAGVKSTPAFLINKTLYQLDAPLTLPDLLRMVQAEKNKH